MASSELPKRVTDAATGLMFSAMRKVFPCRKLSTVVVIHNGQGLKARDRQSGGACEVFGAGGCVGKHTESLHPGPFVVIGRKGSAGKTTYAPRGGWVTDTAYFAVPLRASELDCRFLFYAVKSLNFSDDLISTAIPGINRTAIYAHAVPLPPFVTQIAVVDFLDALSSGVTGSELPGLPEPLAEQGRVVVQIESLAAEVRVARTLRQQALNEAEALWKTALRTELMRCGGEEIFLEDACAEIIDNLHSNPRYADEGVACVRSPDVGWGTLNLETALRTDEEEYRRRTMRGEPQADDIVFVREGGGTGKAAITLEGQRFSLGQRVMMLRPDRERVMPRFLLYQLLSPLIQQDQIGPLCKGSASPHLNIGALRKFRFRCPPLPEQQQTVAELDSLRAELDSLKRLQAETAGELDALPPAILDRAFKGVYRTRFPGHQ